MNTTSSNPSNVLLQKTFPVSFRILNEKMEEKIYLEDQPSSGVLELSNDSGRTLHFVPAHHAAIAGPDNYHFALKFRPGILKSDRKTLITHKIIKKGWTLSIGLVSLETGEVVTLPKPKTRRIDEALPEKEDQDELATQISHQLEEATTVLYFLNTSKASLAPGKKILLPLKHLRMKADEGTQVTQVELSCKNLAKDPDYTQGLLPYIRHFNLTLINHRGNPHMPIHVGFTGFNTILNQHDAENTLTLRITNLQKKTPQSKGTLTFSHHKRSRMYLYFETDGEKSDYALGTVDQVAGIEFEIALPQQKDDKEGNTAHLVHEPMFQGDTPIWEIYPEYGDVVLQPHQTKLHPNESSMLPDDSCMDIELTNIISDSFMGTTHLYLRFENIPGYWDHTYAIPIVKQPMVFRKIGEEERVGVNTLNPSNTFSVKGNADFSGNVGIGTIDAKEKLQIGDYFNNSDTYLSIKTSGGNRFKCGIKLRNFADDDGFTIESDETKNKLKFIRHSQLSHEAMVIDRLNGNVGIGTIDPIDNLQIGDYFNNSDTYLSIKTSGGNRFKCGIKLRNFADDDGFTIESDETKNKLKFIRHSQLSHEAMVIDRLNGNVGIGTSSPNEKLEVDGNIFCTGNNIWLRGNSDKSPIRLRLHHNDQSAYIDWQTGDLNIRNNVTTKLLIKENGNVGIGNTNPGYPLEISGQGSTYPSRSRRYFNSGSDSFGTGTSSSGGVVLVANGSVISTAWFLAVSDIRVKNIINISESKSDLETLRKVEVTDYKYVDEEEFGDRIFKKVIAQQIQNIYPRAINKSKGTVPSVFELAEKVTTTSENTVIRTKKLHNFKTGDKVKLIEEGNGFLIEPITVIDEHTFRIDKIIDNKIFVYGKEVDDLLSVDYDALSVLNISATQELAKQVEVLQAENQKLKAEQEEIKKDLAALKEMFLIKNGS